MRSITVHKGNIPRAVGYHHRGGWLWHHRVYPRGIKGLPQPPAIWSSCRVAIKRPIKPDRLFVFIAWRCRGVFSFIHHGTQRESRAGRGTDCLTAAVSARPPEASGCLPSMAPRCLFAVSRVSRTLARMLSSVGFHEASRSVSDVSSLMFYALSSCHLPADNAFHS